MSYFWRIHKVKLTELIRNLKDQQNYIAELTGEEKELVSAQYQQIQTMLIKSGLLKEPEVVPIKKAGRPKKA